MTVIDITVPDVSVNTTERHQPPTRISDRPKKTTWKSRQMEYIMHQKQMEKATPGKRKQLEKMTPGKGRQLKKVTHGKQRQLPTISQPDTLGMCEVAVEPQFALSLGASDLNDVCEISSQRLVPYSSSSDSDENSSVSSGNTSLVPCSNGDCDSDISEIIPYVVSDHHNMSKVIADVHSPQSVAFTVNSDSTVQLQTSSGVEISRCNDNVVLLNAKQSGIIIYSKILKSSDCCKNRKLPCYFCHKFVFHMARHLQLRHGHLPEVAEVSVLSDKTERNVQFQKLIHCAVFRHNSEVLKSGSGILTVARSPMRRRIPGDFLPCTFCLQFFVQTELYRHGQCCRFRPDNAMDNKMMSAGRALLAGSVKDGRFNADLEEYVFSRMRFDRVRSAAIADPLIVQLGSLLFEKQGHKRASDISARMRELARLLIRLQRDGHAVTLTDALNSSKFDKVIAAVKAEAGFLYTDDDGCGLFKTPAYIVRVVGNLVKCAQIKRGIALKNHDNVSLKDAEDYLSLHRTEFTGCLVSTAQALNGTRVSKTNVNKVLPSPRPSVSYTYHCILYILHTSIKTFPSLNAESSTKMCTRFLFNCAILSQLLQIRLVPQKYRRVDDYVTCQLTA